jgi:hypothetical protein
MEDIDGYDEFENFKAEAGANKKHKDDSYKDNSKRRLLNNLKKKFGKS